jgi:hypothetical protein
MPPAECSFPTNVQPDAQGHIAHDFRWTSPRGVNVSSSFTARIRPDVISLTPENSARLVLLEFEKGQGSADSVSVKVGVDVP